MGHLLEIFGIGLVFSILVFVFAFEETIKPIAEAQLLATISPNEGTLGSSADGKYFENNIQVDFNVVSGILNSGVLQEGTETLDQGEIRFGTPAQWNFLHTPTGSNIMSINFWFKGDLIEESDIGNVYPILSTMDPEGSLGADQNGIILFARHESLRLLILENGIEIEESNLSVDLSQTNDGQWHMITLAIDHGNSASEEIITCLDTVCEPEFRNQPFAGDGGTAAKPLTIGGQSRPIGEDFVEPSFEVDDFTIWHGYFLTSSDIVSLYNGGLGSSAGTTGSNIAPTLQLLHVTFDNVSTPTPDADGDGILYDVDTLSNTYSDDFSDIGLVGTTSGTITTRGDQILTISEEPNPDGVRITADISGGLVPATINACGGLSLVTLSPGDNIIVTCGSVTIDVVDGPVDIIFMGSGGTQATTTILDGNSITFDQDTFSFVAPLTNTQTIIIDVQGMLIPLNPGEDASLNVLSSNKSSFIKQGELNTNEGANTMMRVRDNGNNRALVSFDQNEILSFAQGRTLSFATLRLYIEENGNNWGPNGRTIDVHRLVTDWTEGNGFNDKPENMPLSQFNDLKTRGIGQGVTWECATDAEINNQQTNCSTQWNGATFSLTSTDTVTIFKDNPPTGTVKTVGWIEFDVTSDVQTFLSDTEQNYGWIVKKTEEGAPGLVEFTSDESPTNTPELILVFD